MNDNGLLAEKHRTQTVLDEIAEHDLAQYVADTHTRVEVLALRLGLKLKYGVPALLKSSSEPLTVSVAQIHA